jgi:hypothetical protein
MKRNPRKKQPRQLKTRPKRLPKLQRRRLQRTSRKPKLINKRLRKQLLLQRLNTTEKLELRLKN